MCAACMVCMVCAWCMRGLCMVCAWCMCGLCMVCARCMRGLCMVCAWCMRGLCMVCVWSVHRGGHMCAACLALCVQPDPVCTLPKGPCTQLVTARGRGNGFNPGCNLGTQAATLCIPGRNPLLPQVCRRPPRHAQAARLLLGPRHPRRAGARAADVLGAGAAHSRADGLAHERHGRCTTRRLALAAPCSRGCSSTRPDCNPTRSDFSPNSNPGVNPTPNPAPHPNPGVNPTPGPAPHP